MSTGEDTGVYPCGDPGDECWVIPFRVSSHQLTISVITHLSVGESDRRSLSPSITDVGLWVTATLERIDFDIEYRGSGAGMNDK